MAGNFILPGLFYIVIKIFNVSLVPFSPNTWGKISLFCFRNEDPFQGLKLDSCLTLRNKLSEETHVLTKQEIFLGKGTQVEGSRVRETRKISLSHGSKSWVLW